MASQSSVRLALPRDAEQIARLQTASLASTLGDIEQPAEVSEVWIETWLQAICKPPLATYRVLVALADDAVAGYALTGPSDDEDAEPDVGMIGDFVIGVTGQGHGSRLMQACIDTLRADGFSYASIWLLTEDDLFRAFVLSSGWATDGAHRELGDEEASNATIRQVRLVSAI